MIATTPNTPFFDTNVPAIKQMTSLLNKYNPAITKSIYYDDTAVQNWSDGMLVLAAAKAANWTPSTQVTPAALRRRLLHLLHTTSAGGLMTPITITKGQPETNNCFYSVSIKNNKFTLPHGLTEACVASS